MAKDPAFLFYSSDFLTGTQFFTYEQIGQYIKLLCLQHQQGRLPIKHMLQICGSVDNEVFTKFIKDDNGLYYNERLEVEANKRKAYTDSRRANRLHKKDEPDEAEPKRVEPIDKDKILSVKCDKFKVDLKPFVDEFGKELCNQFYRYWTEPNKTKTKLRWEGEKFFDIKRRLITFRNNEK